MHTKIREIPIRASDEVIDSRVEGAANGEITIVAATHRDRIAWINVWRA
jgi:hypothetical protein